MPMVESCWACGETKRTLLSTHHVTPRCYGGSNAPWNLARLCLPCHSLTHNKVNNKFLRGKLERTQKGSGRYRRYRAQLDRMENPAIREKINRFRKVIELVAQASTSTTQHKEIVISIFPEALHGYRNHPEPYPVLDDHYSHW